MTESEISENKTDNTKNLCKNFIETVAEKAKKPKKNSSIIHEHHKIYGTTVHDDDDIIHYRYHSEKGSYISNNI